MDFTFEEIDYLISRGVLEKTDAHKFGISSAYGSTNMGFGSWGLIKTEEGEFHTWSSSPVNVDCDDGSYDIARCSAKYKTFEDYKNRKAYETQNS